MMHPSSDEFMTAAFDGTVRLWDVRCADTVAQIRADHMPVTHICSSYDTEGVVFAVYTDDHLIRMYDARNYKEGPFAKFSLYDKTILDKIEPYFAHIQAPNVNVSKLHATALTFSPDGNQLLVTTNRGVFLHLDAFEGHLLQLFHAHAHSPTNNQVQLGATYSPDGVYVCTGSDDGKIIVYRANDGMLIHAMSRGHEGAVTDLQWNPQRQLLGSIGGKSTVLWTPGSL